MEVALSVGGSIPGYVEGEEVSVNSVVVTFLESGKKLKIGCHDR